MFDAYGRPKGLYYYHYTTADSLHKILDSASLRMGPYFNTNDPRENKRWHASLTADDGVEIDNDEFFGYSETLEAFIQRRIAVLCLTIDKTPAEREQLASYPFARGWGRARMWDQYGDKHKGACLVLNSEHLRAAVRSIQNVLAVFDSAVSYSDEGLDITLTRSRVYGVEPQTLASSLLAMNGHGHRLLFHKNNDWAAEAEWRFAFWTDDGEPRFVPISSCLEGVVLGEDAPTDMLPVVDELIRKAKLSARVGRCVWMNGSPQVVPAGW